MSKRINLFLIKLNLILDMTLNNENIYWMTFRHRALVPTSQALEHCRLRLKPFCKIIWPFDLTISSPLSVWQSQSHSKCDTLIFTLRLTISVPNFFFTHWPLPSWKGWKCFDKPILRYLVHTSGHWTKMIKTDLHLPADVNYLSCA